MNAVRMKLLGVAIFEMWRLLVLIYNHVSRDPTFTEKTRDEMTQWYKEWEKENIRAEKENKQ